MESLDHGGNDNVMVLPQQSELDTQLERMNIEAFLLPLSAPTGITPYHAVSIQDTDPDNIVYVGKNYAPVQNKQINNLVRQLVDKHGLELVRTQQQDLRRFKWVLKDLSKRAEFVIGNNKYPVDYTVTISNSYDGSEALSFAFGGYIRHCQNLFGLPTKAINSGVYQKTRRKHVNFGSLDFFLDNMLESIEKSAGVWQGVLSKKTWALQGIDKRVKALKELFPERADGSMHPTLQLLNMRMSLDKFGSEEFDLFMAVTNIATNAETYGIGNANLDKLTKFQESFWLN